MVFENPDGSIGKIRKTPKGDLEVANYVEKQDDLVKEEDFARFVGCCMIEADDFGVSLNLQQIQAVYDVANYIYKHKGDK
jgi:hypothetical protein